MVTREEDVRFLAYFRIRQAHVGAPQTVLHMSEKREPGRSRPRLRSKVLCQYSADDVLVDIDTEGQRDLLGNSGTAPTGITPFHFNDSIDEFFARPFRTRPTLVIGRKQEAVLSFDEHAMETQQS